MCSLPEPLWLFFSPKILRRTFAALAPLTGTGTGRGGGGVGGGVVVDGGGGGAVVGGGIGGISGAPLSEEKSNGGTIQPSVIAMKDELDGNGVAIAVGGSTKGKGRVKRFKDLRSEASRINTVCLIAIAAVLIAMALHYLEPVMVPLVLAVVLSYVLAPIVDALREVLRFPKELAIGVALAATFGVLFSLGLLITSSVRELLADLNHYENRFKEFTGALADQLETRGVDRGTIRSQLAEVPIASMIARFTTGFGAKLLEVCEMTFLILIFVIYILQARSSNVRDRPVRTRGLIPQVEKRIKKYLFLKSLLSLAMGASATLIYAFLRVHLAFLFGVITFLLNFLPNIGAVIATMLPIPLMLVNPSVGITRLFLAVLLPTLVHVLIGGVIEPKVMGDSLELHPIVVMLCLIFWGMVWSLPGMLLAAPLTAAVKIFLESAETTRPLGRVLGGDLDAFSGDSETEDDDGDLSLPADSPRGDSPSK